MKEQSCLKEFAKYTSLNVFGMLGMSCYILADTFFISLGIGANGLAALNLALPVYSVIYGSGLMLGMGGATKYSIFKGQGREQNAKSVFTNVVYTAIVLITVFMLMGLFCSGPIAKLMGADAEVFAMTRIYLKVILLFSPAFILNSVLLCFVRNDGSPKLAMCGMLFGCLSNIVLDYIFIFICGWGILGAVLATGGSPIVGMLIMAKHLRSEKNEIRIEKERPQIPLIRDCISLGVPSLVTEVSAGIVMLIFNMLILRLEGNIGVAAYGVIANISIVVVSMYNGISQGVQPIISRAYGEGNKENVKKVMGYAWITVVVISILLYAMVFFMAGPITSVFNSEGNLRLQQIAEHGLKLYFIAAPFVGFNILVAIYFTSVERALPAHVISLLRGFFLIIPTAFVLAYVAGITGIWLTFPVTECLVAIFAWIVYQQS